MSADALRKAIADRSACVGVIGCGYVGLPLAVGFAKAGYGVVAVDVSAQGRVQRPMTFEDFAAVKTVGDPQVSPDGKWVLYSFRTTDVGANKRTTVTKLLPTAGGSARIFPDANTRAAEARWSPDGKRVAYTANGQLWIADATGANPRQITNVNGGASGPVWAPTSDRIAFVTGVYPDCDSAPAAASPAAPAPTIATSNSSLPRIRIFPSSGRTIAHPSRFQRSQGISPVPFGITSR